MENVLFQELLGALRRRLVAADHGDVSVLFDEFAADEADQLTAMLDSGGAEAAAPLAKFRWLRYLATEPKTDLADLSMAIRLVGKVSPELREDIPPPLRLLATIDPGASGDPEDWYRYAVRLLDDPAPEVLDDVVGLLTVVERTATGELQPRALEALASAVFRRLGDSSDPALLDAAIVVGTQVRTALPVGHPHRWIFLNDLALVLRRRFLAAGDPGDLDAAIATSRAAVDAHPSGAVVQSGLAIALRTRYGLTGDQADLSGAVDHGRTAAKMFADGDPERAVSLAHLAAALLIRAQETGSTADLDEALACARAAAALPGERHPSHALHVLAEVLTQRFARNKLLPDLLELEQTLRQLLARGAPEEFRGQLAQALAFHADLTQEMRHFDEAVEIWRELAGGAGSLAARRMYGLILGVMLRLRAETAGSIEDLVDGIMCTVRAVAKSPDADRPELAALRGRLRDYARTGDAGVLLNPAVPLEVAHVVKPDELPHDLEARTLAGWVLWIRALHSGERAEEEAERAAEVLYDVYLVMPDAVPDALAANFRDGESAAADEIGTTVEAWRHNGSGMLLLERFFETGEPAPLHAAIRQLRQAVDTAVGEESHAAAYNNLALALAQLASFGGGREVLVEAVAAARRSVELSAPDVPYRPGRLSLLCGVLGTLGGRDADLDLIQEARRVGELAVALTPADHPSLGTHMTNLYTALVMEYRYVGDLALLQDAVNRFHNALPLLPPGHPHHVTARLSFASALHELAKATDRAEPLREAERILCEAEEDARGWQRLQVLHSLACTLDQLYRRTGGQPALVGAIASGRQVIVETAREDPELLPRLRDLAAKCSTLFAHTNDEAVLDEAIALLRRAQSVAGPDDPELRGARILTMLLRWKAEDTSDASFLEEATVSPNRPFGVAGSKRNSWPTAHTFSCACIA